MQYIHVRNLEKYHPGYKDRTLQYAKIFTRMVQGDPDCDLIENEVDWGRLIKFILLELEAQAPLPLSPLYLAKKGFNIKARPIELTLRMLHNFIDIVTDEKNERNVDKDKEKEKEEDKEKEKEATSARPVTVDEVIDFMQNETEAKKFWNYYTSNGWRVGKNAMRDWKAAARGWLYRSRTDTTATSLTVHQANTLKQLANLKPTEALNA